MIKTHSVWAVDVSTQQLHRFPNFREMARWIYMNVSRSWVTEGHWAYSAVVVARRKLFKEEKIIFPIKLSRYMFLKWLKIKREKFTK